jgi:hypothetical protein
MEVVMQARKVFELLYLNNHQIVIPLLFFNLVPLLFLHLLMVCSLLPFFWQWLKWQLKIYPTTKKKKKKKKKNVNMTQVLTNIVN